MADILEKAPRANLTLTSCQPLKPPSLGLQTFLITQGGPAARHREHLTHTARLWRARQDEWTDLVYPKCLRYSSKPREIHKFTQRNSAFHVAACRCFRDREVGEGD